LTYFLALLICERGIPDLVIDRIQRGVERGAEIDDVKA